jgi:hypothetical protein
MQSVRHKLKVNLSRNTYEPFDISNAFVTVVGLVRDIFASNHPRRIP